MQDVACLRPYKPVADLLAAKSDWRPLYKPELLAANSVPTAALSYTEVGVWYHTLNSRAGDLLDLKMLLFFGLHAHVRV